MCLKIEQLVASDFESASQIHSLWVIAYRAEARLIQAKEFPPLWRSLADIQQSETLFYGGFKQTALVAVVELAPAKKDLNIHSLIVHPRYWRQGFGSQLLGFVLATFNFDTASVSTAQLNAPALALFAKHGFTETGRWLSPENIDCIDLSLSRM